MFDILQYMILFYNRHTMFKKRTIKKQTNIEDLLTEITTTQAAVEGQENSKDMDKCDIDNGGQVKSVMNKNINVNQKRNRLIENSIDIDEDVMVIKQSKIDQRVIGKQNGDMSKNQIYQCFADFLQGQKLAQSNNRQETINELKYNYYQQQQEQALKNNPIQSEQNIINLEQEYQQIHREQNQENRKLPVIHEVIIEDESGEQVEVREDYGEVSDFSHSENYEEGYQNQIIKKTLSKYNYDKVSQNLSHAQTKNKQNKLLKQLGKISYSGIQRKIAKDLRMKKQKKGQVLNQLKYIDSKIKQRQTQITEKMKNKQKMATDLDRIKRILQLLYYYGSQIEVEWVDQARLSEMAYEQEWKQRVDKIRHNILKNKKQFDQKHNIDQEQSQKQKSEGSQGDVQEIGKHKVEEGWNGWEVEDEDDNNKNQRQNNDDDQYIQVDD